MAPLTQILLLTLAHILLLTPPTNSSSLTAAINTTASKNNLSSTVRSWCQSTPYPDSCLSSLKLSITITINPSFLSFILQSLTSAISEATSIVPLLSSPRLTERQRGSVRDCQELHQATLSSLKRSAQLIQSSSADIGKRQLSDVKAHLSAALTNKNTCLEGLAGATGPDKDAVVGSLAAAYRHVSNSLSLVSRPGPSPAAGKGRRRLLGGVLLPAWVKRKDRRLLQSGDYDGYDPSSILTVAADGSGNFTTINDAIAFAPNVSDDRTLIIVRAGLYEENVEVNKTNIVMLGDGSDVTVIRGNRSVGGGWTTFRSATVAVSGEGFLARDLAFENTAGPAKGQAVALRINADLSAIFRCKIDGYQDTLYVHSFRQFYRDCNISGTVDFIFGNAAVILQNCNIYAKLPMPRQSIMITAQGRDDPNEATGISIQNCSIAASDDLAASNGPTKVYLGRPWRNYSTTVYIESYIDGIVQPSGWSKWSASDSNETLSTVYYGEYQNSGAGAWTDRRVNWPGFHLMEYDDAYNFTVSQFIYGDQWLDSTSFPYDDWI